MLDSGRFTRSGGLGAGIADQVADDKVLAEFAAGATLVLQGLHRTWPPLVDFAQQLSTDLGHPGAGQRLCHPGVQPGFRPALRRARRDRAAGRRRRSAGRSTRRCTSTRSPTSRGPTIARPSRPAPKSRPSMDTVLRPGDALYLPRGWLHSAEALGDNTIHLTVGIHATTRYDVLQSLVALAADSPELRASLPLGIDAGRRPVAPARPRRPREGGDRPAGPGECRRRGRRRTPPDRPYDAARAGAAAGPVRGRRPRSPGRRVVRLRRHQHAQADRPSTTARSGSRRRPAR